MPPDGTVRLGASSRLASTGVSHWHIRTFVIAIIRSQPCALLKYKLCFIKYRLNLIKYKFNFIKYNLYFKGFGRKVLIWVVVGRE